jgi:hypothetical protein
MIAVDVITGSNTWNAEEKQLRNPSVLGEIGGIRSECHA